MQSPRGVSTVSAAFECVVTDWCTGGEDALGIGVFRRMRVTMETTALRSAILPSFDAESYVEGSKAV